MDIHKNVFYLKVNRIEGYTIRNLWQWMATIEEYGDSAIWFVICDNNELKKKIITQLSVKYPDIEEHFLTCIINDETTFIISRVTDERWKMAGYAHLTTFIHARDNHYYSFWNIDADDTKFCLSAKRTREMLLKAEEYALMNHIDGFSLDMHTSRVASGKHWSFGVTYLNNQKDWGSIMKKLCQEDLTVEDPDDPHWYLSYNIDRFFRYIRNRSEDVKLENFYVENLKFIHYSNDFFWRLCQSALYHWRNGYLTLPILYYAVGLKNRQSQCPIDKIVIKLDIGITDEESMVNILETCNSPTLYLRDKNR